MLRTDLFAGTADDTIAGLSEFLGQRIVGTGFSIFVIQLKILWNGDLPGALIQAVGTAGAGDLHFLADDLTCK